MLNETQLKLWHPNKNNLNPKDLSSGSHKKAWWLGECGHEWEQAIADMAGNCVYCLNKRVLTKFNDLATLFPDVAKEWHPTKNGFNKPENTISTSTKKAWWVCEKGHEWEVYIRNRTSGSKCPFCTNYKILTGFNDLATKYPQIAQEWHPTRNSPILPDKVGAKTSNKYWWQCDKGHEWKTTVSHRTVNGSGCPKCNINEELLSSQRNLVKEFNFVKNSTLDFELLRLYEKTKVWWICEYRHEWQAQIYERYIGGTNCPVCSNKQISVGFNDLGSKNPELLSEWDYFHNKIKPTELTANSNKKIYWKCSKNHRWVASPNSRINKGKLKGCPVCKNRYVVPGFNDFASRRPEWLGEWDYAKNNNIAPNEIGYKSVSKVWWRCNKGHEWQASIYNRQQLEKECPQCINKRMTSKAEVFIKEWLFSLGFNVLVSTRNLLPGYEVDLYIPEAKLGIEYNGIYWHRKEVKPPEYHLRKFQAAKQNGVTLLQVWENDFLSNIDAIKSKISSYLLPSNNIKDFHFEICNDSLNVYLNKNTAATFKIYSSTDGLNFELHQWQNIELKLLIQETHRFLRKEYNISQKLALIISNDWPVNETLNFEEKTIFPVERKVSVDDKHYYNIYDSGKTIYFI